jgi:pyrroloquinoline quinone biosynthesis protein E
VEIKLQGMGEPLMQGDDFFEMIRIARARHIWVRTTTNASLLHLKDNYRKLIDTGVNEVQISIDGADKETFESIRRGGHFETVVANCKLVNAYCRDVGRMPTKMWTVVQRNNVGQLDRLVDLAAEMGFKSQVFGLNLVDWGNAQWRETNDNVSMLHQFDVRTGERLIERGRAAGVDVRFWNASETYRTDLPGKRCPWPFERAYVGSDGRVSPCCLIANPDAYEIGNGGSLAAVWKSDEFRAFRQTHITGGVPDVCRICYDRRQDAS